MNQAQRLWWAQAKSDHEAFVCLRRAGVQECHLLHYLQMATEKIGKAYLWRSGKAPPRSHVGLMRFLQALLSRGHERAEIQRIAEVFGYKRASQMAAWVKEVSGLAHQLQILAPDLANDGPNPEDPWPQANPTACPALHSFELWATLRDSEPGRRLLKFIQRAIDQFEKYA
jgi:hypothetical protein